MPNRGPESDSTVTRRGVQADRGSRVRRVPAARPWKITKRAALRATEHVPRLWRLRALALQ